MGSEQPGETTEPESLPPKQVTERFDSLEPGDEVTINSHELTYEVVETDTYSVIAEGPDGRRVTFAQNLQTGGWNFTEEITHVETASE